MQAPLFPLCWLDRVDLAVANDLLERFGHRMGPVLRPMNGDVAHVLFHEAEPVAVAVASTLIRPRVGAGLGHLTRDRAIELSRLCAARPGLCRVMLRLWREVVFPSLGYPVAVSYQDAALHSGNLYRFDGWARSEAIAHSGTDSRSGRRGRDKWVWVWPPAAATPSEAPSAPSTHATSAEVARRCT